LIIYKKVSSSGSAAKTASTSTASKPTTSTTTSTTKPSTPSVYYVKPGDSLWTISQKYPGLSVDKIKQLNGLKTNSIKVGQKLILS